MADRTDSVRATLLDDANRAPVKALLLGAALVLVAGCSGATDETTATTRAAGTTAFPNDKTAYDYFTAKGLTSFQAAGIVGNLDQESGVDPTIAQENGGPGRGIAQWSVGGRWDSEAGDNLVAFAAKEGLPTSSLTVQLDFVWYELETFSSYGLATLRGSTNVTDAATDFEIDFEECDIASECDASSRVAYAKDVLAAYGNDGVGTTDAGRSDAGKSDAGAPDASGSTPGGGALHPAISSGLCLAVSGEATANGSAVVAATCNGTSSQSWAFEGGNLRVYGTKCLDVPSGNTTNGTKLQIWDCGAGNTNQSWTQTGSTIVWTGKGKCLDLTDGVAASGTAVQSWSCSAGDENQEW
jgi:Phage tail lysozyme/Ricin-type beta-trefoil lectin domain